MDVASQDPLKQSDVDTVKDSLGILPTNTKQPMAKADILAIAAIVLLIGMIVFWVLEQPGLALASAVVGLGAAFVWAREKRKKGEL